MKCKPSLVVLVLLLASSSAFAQAGAPLQPSIPLHNSDVLRMHTKGLKPGVIIASIVTSSCNFDIFPPVMRELRMRGVPDTVLMAMTMVPYGPPSTAVAESEVAAPDTVPVQIPAGTVVRVEAANAVSSADVSSGNPITFLVSRRVFVNDVLVIERGAVARARVVKSKRGSAWGRAGMLEFALEDVVAIDGTRIPIQLSKHVNGANRTKAVTAAAILTGAIVFPYSPPVALLWALKKGDDAVLDESTKFVAVVNGVQNIAGLPPEKKKIIYHAVNTMNAAVPSQGTGLSPSSNSFRPTPLHQK
jgi:hypothetical protein